MYQDVDNGKLEEGHAADSEETEQMDEMVSLVEQTELYFESLNFPEEEYLEIYLVLCDPKHKIDNVDRMGLGTAERENFVDYSIPSNALYGVENFWVGLQTVFYAVERNFSIVLMRGCLDEVGNGDISYEEIARF